MWPMIPVVTVATLDSMKKRRRSDPLKAVALPLSPEQRALAEGWLGACMRLSRDYEKLHRLHRGDLLADAWAACCHAAYRFDPNRGYAFGSYVWPTLRRYLARAAVRQNEDVIRGYELFDSDGAQNDDEGSDEAEPEPAWMAVLTDRERIVVRMRAEGENLKVCGQAVGLTGPAVSRMLDVIREKVRRHL